MGVPGNANALLLRSAAAAGGYQVERSLRFNAPDSAFLSRTPGSAGNRKTWTWAGWVKRSALGVDQALFSVPQGGGYPNTGIVFNSSNQLRFFASDASANVFAERVTSAVYRDTSAWMHTVVAVDYANAQSKIYVNNSEITAFASSTGPTNTDGLVNASGTTHVIGQFSSTWYFSGYLADVYFIDGQALDPSSFVETSATTGQLIPKAYTGSFGTNGFWLKFSDNSAATATTLGKDYSGNSNNWTPNNLSVTAGAGNDSLVDTPTSYGTDTSVGGEVRGNYATLNPLIYGGSISAPTNGNLDISSGSSYGTIYATIGANSGKWYWEFTNTSTGSNGSCVGIAAAGATLSSDAGAYSKGYIYCSGALKANNNSYGSYGASWNTSGDIIGVAFDSDNGTLTFYKNGSSQGQAYSGIASTTEYYFPVFADASGSASGGGSFNFGQRPFAYTAPSGFKALCDANLPAPVVAKPNTVMDVALWTGNGSARSITGLGFNPDLVWIKGRSGATDHALYDVVRGAQARLESNTTDAEVTSDGGVTAFNSDGFSLGTLAQVNTNSATYAGWAWDAGTTTSSNGSGSITSSVRANASAGFSIVTYTGNGTSGATIGHGLGVKPGFVIIKSRSGSGASYYWICYHSSLGATQALELDSTTGAFSAPGAWNNTEPTSSVISVAGNAVNNGSGSTYVAYCFSPVAGYSSMGSYVGNGSADGPFVFTGFRPRWLMIKVYSGDTGAWRIYDSLRNTYNVVDLELNPNTSGAEYTASNTVDFTSNGFKIRTSNINVNLNTAGFIYFAVAENPFQYARAR